MLETAIILILLAGYIAGLTQAFIPKGSRPKSATIRQQLETGNKMASEAAARREYIGECVHCDMNQQVWYSGDHGERNVKGPCPWCCPNEAERFSNGL